MSNFGTNLKNLRTSLEITQGEMANRLCVSKSTIAMYESGQREPNIDVLLKISETFSVDVSYLIGSSDNFSLKNAKLKEWIDEGEKLTPSQRKQLIALIKSMRGDS